MTGRISAQTEKTVPRPSSVRLKIGMRVVFALGMACLILGNSAAAVQGALGGLQLCAYAVIPSLFPFLVLSPILADGIRRAVFFFCRRWLDARGAALISAFAVGMFAGFPIGALTLLSQYGQGMISREDAARLLGVCTGASPAFLIGYFGKSLWGSALLGWVFWLGQCLVCLIGLMMLMRGTSMICRDTVPLFDRFPALGECLSSAVPRMLQICGTVVFFSVLRAFFCDWFGGNTAVLLGGLTEMTGGLRDARAFCESVGTDGRGAFIISAAVIGFGGGCVGMQIANAAADAGISMKFYWMQRAVLGLIGALAAMLFPVIGCGIG